MITGIEAKSIEVLAASRSGKLSKYSLGRGPWGWLVPLIVVNILAVGFVSSVQAQIFDSGSDGSDGALMLNTPGMVVFDPTTFTPPLDPDGDGVYHFTTVTIATGVTVRLAADVLGTRPVVWLASGDIQIGGVLDLDGEQGHAFGAAGRPAVGGAGGYWGGLGSTNFSSATNGLGPGAGRLSTNSPFFGASGAGHHGNGTNTNGTPGGSPYGSEFLIPLFGGSGGGGGGATSVVGGGGGAGGGAVLLASSSRIEIGGEISAKGGSGVAGASPDRYAGGGGSGGAVRVIAPVIAGSGSINVDGGANSASSGSGSRGRVRLEAFDLAFTGTTDSQTRFSNPGFVFPSGPLPSVRVTAIDGVAVPASPTGHFPPADLTINNGDPVTFDIQASNIPLGTVVRVAMLSETRDLLFIDSSPLTGTLESSTASATAVVPIGFSRFTVEANWTP
ncbi:MAG: hypothetical protein K0U98_24525 [Deltaproteobacteria bacterium]|nr:hypothetical protein [Deltaproteobacteria bacterium]